MIEVGKRSQYAMSYDDALFYCFCLGDGWRLPTGYEYTRDDISVSWGFNDTRIGKPLNWYVTPVRDLKDD